MDDWRLVLLIGWATSAALMAVLWTVQWKRGNAGIVDIAWAFAVGLLAILFCWAADGYWARRLLVATLAALWSARLTVYLFVRVLSSEEDGRYAALRRRWGSRTQFYLFLFFQVQAVWAVIFAFPMLVAAWNDSAPLELWDVVAIAIWTVSVVGETIADRQLARFKRDPNNRGKVCDVGLWRYSRHPNYFFEWMHWWAYVAFAATGQWGWLALLGPATMLLFLFKVTGIPPTEARALESRGDAYRRYQQTTSAFFPWPPRRAQ